MKKKIIIGAVAVGVIALIYLLSQGGKKTDSKDILVSVKTGKFRVEIETTGELEAKNSVKITGPTALRDFRIWNITIQSIIDEGTVVKKGDWIANLDPSEFQTRYQEKELELERALSQFTQTQLDTTLQMRNLRDDLINLSFDVEEKQIILEQSQFEPPATIKQAEINLDKSKRNYQQALENYKIKRQQNIEQMREVAASLRKVQNEFSALKNLQSEFTIRAPESGMVIYTKGFDGRPIKAGSQINAWDPTVATLPDLTKMVSKTYVNEVDVRKVKRGQQVEIGLDAFPDKRLRGVVTRVANVGETRQNSDAKVFQVDVDILGTDESLRPAMTTSNRIIASEIENALYVPLECLHNEFDSITYVYKREGITTVKQEIMLGETNANEAVILAGLTEGDKVYLSIPGGQEGQRIRLIPEMDGKRKREEAEPEPVLPQGGTFTLPDGRVITMPPGGVRPNGNGAQQSTQQPRQGNQQQRQGTRPQNN
ncbi:MAG TPA: HlyD family efflux transporter periplasmic adaptor subunit [Cyclobacteriaceae bacterium]|nr:HlyD family efflux transporter periplasmic adaptor subunit [Cyclobacteriaceae bacterium]